MIPTVLIVMLPWIAPPESLLAVSDGAILSIDEQWQLIEAAPRLQIQKTTLTTATAVVVGKKQTELYLLSASHSSSSGLREYQFFNRQQFPTSTFSIKGNQLTVLNSPIADLVLLKLSVSEEQFAAACVLPIAEPGNRPKQFPFEAISIGCSMGGTPSVNPEVIVAKRFAKREAEGGAFFWESKQEPPSGRSGGPLISKGKKLIGLCTAAKDSHGYYAHLDEIHAVCKEAGCEWLYASISKTR